jgi:hypothetical protein
VGKEGDCQGAVILFTAYKNPPDRDRFSFSTLFNCSGQSICCVYNGSTGERAVECFTCNFVGNHGPLFVAQSGPMVLTVCHFVDNAKLDGSDRMDAADMLQLSASAVLIACFFM